MEGRPNLKPRFVVPRLLAEARLRQGGRRAGERGRQLLHVRFDGAVTGGQLRLTRVEEFEILLQDEEMLGPIVAGQGGDDLRL
jgi:hypothetical protein